MDFQQDWVLRQIEMLVQFISKTLFKRDSIDYQVKDEANQTQTDQVYKNIKNLLEQCRICEAENLLYEKMDSNDKEYLRWPFTFTRPSIR